MICYYAIIAYLKLKENVMKHPYYDEIEERLKSLSPRLIKAFNLEVNDYQEVIKRVNWIIHFDRDGWLNSTCSINKVPSNFRTKVRLKRMLDNICEIKYDSRMPKLSETKEKPYWLINKKSLLSLK